MTKGVIKTLARSKNTGDAFCVCRGVCKSKLNMCYHFVTRLKQVFAAEEGSEDWKIARILSEGRADRRNLMSKKLARGCFEGHSKHKTKIDEVKAEKKALRERLRRSEGRVRQLEGLLAKNKPE